MDLTKVFVQEPVVNIVLLESEKVTMNQTVYSKEALTRETRQESFEHVQETLGERQRIVLEQLESVFEDGATAKELSNHLYRQGLAPSPERNSVHPRLNELIAKGLVEVIGKKTCQFTNRKVAIYKSKK